MPVRRKQSPIDRVLGRIEDLDATNLAVLVQRLARERALLETIFHVVREGILVIGDSGIIEYANTAAFDLIGLRQEELGNVVLWKMVPELARTLGGLLHPGGLARPMAVSREVEITYPEPRMIRLYFVPIPIESEEERGRTTQRFAVILTDITDEIATTEERIEDERVNSVFELSAGVAHEIGNPLNSINIHLQLLKRTAQSIEQDEVAARIRRSVDICSQEVERLDGIIRHFLQAIRPSQPDLRDVNLLDCVTEIIDLLGEEMQDLSIRVELAVSQEIPAIIGDAGQLRQVLFNVVKNAMEAMDSGGELRISTRTDDEFVYLFVADTGRGIPQEDLAQIFKPFFTSKVDGHGLGMMIVQRILRQHGAQIGIDSRENTGTVVTLQFPLKHRRIRLLESRGESVPEL